MNSLLASSIEKEYHSNNSNNFFQEIKNSITSMKKYIKIAIAIVVVISFIATFSFLYSKSQPALTEYNEHTPIVGDINKTTIITGKIEPRDEVSVKPQISGIITALYKEAGEHVNEGEVIAKVKVIPDMAQLSSAESRVRSAEITLEQAKTDYSRDEKLHKKQLISDEAFDKTSQALKKAKEEMKAAQDNYDIVRDGVSSSNASASSTLIRSTITGIILNVPVKVGNTVVLSNTFNDGTTIATVANMSDIIFRGNIDETEVGRLEKGMKLKIKIGALQDIEYIANLEYISPKAVENNGASQFEIKAAVDVNKGKTIRAGYSANAEIILASAKGVITLPESTIEYEGDSTFVYIVKGEGKEKTYERRNVITGLSDGINIEIKKGVTKNDKVRGTEMIK